ncbi:MAG: GspE/PulE family protein, partial [Lentisphaeria bacterium]
REQFPVEHEQSTLLTPKQASELGIIPLNMRLDGLLNAALADPMNLRAIDMAEAACGVMIMPVLCTNQELELLLSQVYGFALHNFDSYNFASSSELEIKDVKENLGDVELQIASARMMSDDEPVVQTVNWILTEAVNRRASDIHISPEKKVIQLRFRINGHLQDAPSPPFNMFQAIVSRIKILSKMDIASTMVPQDGRFSVLLSGKEINIRVSSIPTINGENIVMRLLDNSAAVKSVSQLGMLPTVEALLERAINNPYGMVLATGPTGSGKSTTLYALLSKIVSPEKNIITVEDPVEYRMANIRQVQLNEKVGMTFASALRSILRQDPDVVMVGEIRDGETAAIACRAALTGHMVLSTIHTNNSVGAIERLSDMGIASFIIASTLTACMAQRLIRRL